MQLSQIKGIGESRAEKLRSFGIETPFDLVCSFPYKYIEPQKINDLSCLDNQEVVIFGVVSNVKKLFFAKMSATSVVVKINKTQSLNGGEEITAVFFNQPFVGKAVKIGTPILLMGKLKREQSGALKLSAPIIINAVPNGSIIPLYRKNGLNRSLMESAVKFCLTNLDFIDIIPPNIRQKYDLPAQKDALFTVHFPKDVKDVLAAKNALATEQLAYVIGLYRLSKGNDIKNHRYSQKNIIADFTKTLPFALTDDQFAAIQKIVEQLNMDKPANILLEGDVGSGKTVVALAALYYTAVSGHQGAFMSPTDILARQHYQTACDFFGRYDACTSGVGIKSSDIVFLSGSLSQKERMGAQKRIENGAKIVIGTHSVLSESINFSDLALVVVDEQQRFGVLQRGALLSKGCLPDTLVMTATPIPRTLALTFYGDLEVASIKTAPQKQAIVYTRFVESKIAEMYDYIFAKAESGEQTFIVCPRIEDDDELDIIGVKSVFAKLKSGKFGGYVGLLHGKMKEKERSSAIDAFARGDIRVLVCTTIVEVGIDIPAATTIVIYNAERYGLSQLHQLRGRVGRRNKDSYCFLLSTREAYENRLKYLAECSDGFMLSEYDFMLRGAGDFLGYRQHGRSLSFSGVNVDAALITKAKEVSVDIMDNIKAASNTQDLIIFRDLALN